MNVEWWGGEQSSPPADYKSALPLAPLLVWAYLPSRRLRHFLHGGRSWGRDRLGRHVDVP